MIPSPLNTNPKLRELAVQTRLSAQLLRALDEFKSGIAEVRRMVEEARGISKEGRAQLARINSLPKGEKGDSVRGPQGIQGKSGKDGYTPQKGKDYLTQAEIEEIASLASLLVTPPKDGLDAAIDYDLLVEKTMERLTEKKYLREDIEGIRTEMASYRNQLAGKHYGKNTWARGGGDTVAAGTNITIVPNESGQKVISANPGGPSILTETVTATDAGGNNVNIDLTQLSQPWTAIQMVIRNGVIQNQSKWSIVGDTLTLTGAVSTNDFQIQYSYA